VWLVGQCRAFLEGRGKKEGREGGAFNETDGPPGQLRGKDEVVEKPKHAHGRASYICEEGQGGLRRVRGMISKGRSRPIFSSTRET
jgi:hypothetical protein